MVDIILLRPENPGNIGAVARVMANFGFENLVLVDPKGYRQDNVSTPAFQRGVQRAKHGKYILDNSKIISSIPEYDLLVGTSGKVSSEYNLTRTTLTPYGLREKIGSPVESETGEEKLQKGRGFLQGEEKLQKGRGPLQGILFGPEGKGLTNEELKKCDFTVHIPASRNYPVLNLSHAVGIILYEICKGGQKTNYKSASKEQKNQLIKIFKSMITKIDYPDYRKDNTIVAFKNMLGRCMLSGKEANILIGAMKKIKRGMNKDA